jgi:hypothetical protein
MDTPPMHSRADYYRRGLGGTGPSEKKEKENWPQFVLGCFDLFISLCKANGYSHINCLTSS